MSTIKFVYRSQNIPDTLPIEGSQKTITSGAVYTAINNIQMDTLFKSGYLPEGIASVIPQHKLVYANGALTLKAGANLFKPNGFDSDGEFLFTKVTTAADITESRTYSENYDSYIFVDPSENKLIMRTKRSNVVSLVTGEPLDSITQQVWAQKLEPTVAQSTTSNGAIWWDLTENKIKIFKYEVGTFVECNYAIPLGVVTSLNNVVSGIQQDFLMAGIIGNVTWINPGAAVIVPTGKNPADSTYTNEVLETTDVIAKIVLEENVDEISDYGLFLNIDGEIEGPCPEYAFDNAAGMFIDSEGIYHQAARYALVSAGHLTTATRDPLTCTSFSVRPTMALADNDDIEYVIRLLGSSMGLTIDDLEAEIQAANADRALLRQQVKAWLANLSDTIKDDLHHSITHKQMPVKKYFVDSDNIKHEYVVSGIDVGFYKVTDDNPLEFVALTYDSVTNKYKDADNHLYTLSIEDTTPSVLNPDIAVDETIYGTKTFDKTIVGNISGVAQNVKVTRTSEEIIPLGLTSYNTSGNNDIKSANTTVRITNNSVKATLFEGTCTSARWADLAEMYETDQMYPIGTLLRWGGAKELTLANMGVANAVVSEKPAFLMNAEGEGQPVALAGRVKVRILGKVKKHDAIVLNEMAPGVGKVQENASEIIVARALEDNDFVGEKLVMCVVRFSL